jgi:Xaa-Pro aminopeptidase
MNAENKPAQIQTRIAALRAAMQASGIAVYLVPSSDPHLSEYLPERWKGREWLSGFTGSMGTLVIMLSEVAVFADSRYWTQAEKELLHTGITLEKIPTGAAANHVAWISDRIQAHDVVAFDGSLLGVAHARLVEQAVLAKGGKIRSNVDLLDQVWVNRSALPQAKIYQHTAPHAGLTRAEKLAAVRAAMQRAGAQSHFISTLDDIAWLLNLRGQDVDYNPVFIAHFLLEQNTAQLFVDQSKISAELRSALSADSITLIDYDQTQASLKKISQGSTVLVDPKRITLGFIQAFAAGVKLVEQINPSTLLKSRKTAHELNHVRAAMEQDGAALCEFFAWFEGALNKERITELTIDEKITAARAKRPDFVCPSFSTIAGFNANGALPHYRAWPEAHAVISGDGLLLIDSGGQYKGGTTDITRVVPVNQVSPAMKRDYTAVLRGMINLTLARFPRGTLSPMLDSLARAPIWQHGVEYGHGTGHGVGYFLNVHEGPQSISKAQPDPTMAMEPGMITSNEPGIYREGQWGIRIENLVMNVPYTQSDDNRQFGEFLQFETLTLCPIDTRCIDKTLLQPRELDWLNAYHSNVRARLLPHVAGAAKAWLIKRTQPI